MKPLQIPTCFRIFRAFCGQHLFLNHEKHERHENDSLILCDGWLGGGTESNPSNSDGHPKDQQVRACFRVFRVFRGK